MFFTSLTAQSNDVEEIRDSVVSFLNTTSNSNYKYTHKNISTDLIRDLRKNATIEEEKTGVFLINTFSAHEKSHFLLVDENDFSIINMHEPFDANMEKLINFFKKNIEYTKEDIIFYISDFIRIHNYNKVKENSREEMMHSIDHFLEDYKNKNETE